MNLTHDRRVVLLAAAAALPAWAVAEILLWTRPVSTATRWALTILLLLGGVVCLRALWVRIVRPLQTVANLLSAMRDGDFSIQARGGQRGDALGEVLLEINGLVEILREQRLGALEATALLRKVMEEIDVAIFAFDAEDKLRLTNKAGERLLGQAEPLLLHRNAAELGLAESLASETPRVIEATFPGGSGRWEMRPSVFRQTGLPHRLLVIADVSRPLREEERQAWQRLIRVIGHELNNSLAPIQSISGSLVKTLGADPLPEDWRDDMSRGLAVIGKRAEALSRFTNAYAKLARLPEPRPQRIDVAELVTRVAGLETRRTITVTGGPTARVAADPDQVEQALINLVRNAVDAALETGGDVAVGWRRAGGDPPQLEISIEDDGPGISSTKNLFVPFFTTKPGGSGIGLVLCRQIAEAHGGALTLENRSEARGAVARLRLPLAIESEERARPA